MTYLLWLWLLPMVTALPYYTAVKSSESFIRRHGPMNVSNQYECALACSCASGLLSNDDCKVFNPSLPGVNCLAYSYNFTSRQCALLGGPSPNMCSVPVTIYKLGNSIGRNPKCGPITVDEKVICDSDGYKCPAEHLPYIHSDFGVQFIGGHLVHFNGTQWILNSLYGPNGFNSSHVQTITCHPAATPSYAACLFNGNSPRFTYALLVKDTFGCFPGTKLFLVYTKEKTLTTVPVCTKDGWLEQALGAPITSPITNIRCSK